MDNTESIEKRQSLLFKAVRFPLIVLILIAHSLAFDVPEITFSLDGWNIYHFVSEMISHNYAPLAVCWFFVFSGYFFFKNLPEGGISVSWTANKLKKRIHSLLIPYLCWNLGLALLTFIKTKLFIMAGLGDDGGVQMLKETGPLYWLLTGPLNFPLWYMRDLMLLSILAPLWYWVFKKNNIITCIILLLVYLSPLNTSIPGVRSIFFFGIGAFLGINSYNILAICRRLRSVSYILSPLLLIVATLNNASSYHEFTLRLFFPFGMIAFMNFFDQFINSDKRAEVLCSLASTVFFIYACHEVFILGWTKGFLLRLLGEGLVATWIRYIMVPVIVLIVCMALYRIVFKVMPKTLAFTCGERAKR